LSCMGEAEIMKPSLRGTLGFVLGSLMALTAHPATAPFEPLDSLDIDRYMGMWYQVALYPNRFQAQCVADTTASYGLQPDGAAEVVNRCRNASGAMEEVTGLARPDGALNGSTSAPARLGVSFLPAWTRWPGPGWASYWAVWLANDYRHVVVSEPRREDLWVLSRAPQLSAGDNAAVHAWLQEHGFDLSRLQMHGTTLSTPLTPR
jgi:apolipoprotein D and lipocalin family protein